MSNGRRVRRQARSRCGECGAVATVFMRLRIPTTGEVGPIVMAFCESCLREAGLSDAQNH
jgi:hypothetical protein